MQTSQSTTPYGRRPYSLALMETQIVAQSCPAETIAHKWQVLDDIRKAKDAIGLSDRSIAVLNALLSFHQETTLTGGEPIVVFPSNKSLAQRANGMAENSLRRHLSALVFLGLIFRPWAAAVFARPHGTQIVAQSCPAETIAINGRS